MENEKPGKLKNQGDVSPSEQLEKIIIEEPELEHPPKITGTGSNREVFNGSSIIIKRDEEQNDVESPSSPAADPDA